MALTNAGTASIVADTMEVVGAQGKMTKQSAARQQVLELIDRLGVGTAIPSERQLSADLGVARYRFDGLVPGTYTVREMLLPGWVQSEPLAGAYTATLTSGQALTGQDFGNYRPVVILGQVFHDYDTNGVRDPGEPGLQYWVVYLDANNNGQFDPGETYTKTNAGGQYALAYLTPGTSRYDPENVRVRLRWSARSVSR